MDMKTCIAVIAILVVMLMCAAPAQAQSTRTWVSGVGDDANPCSRTAPCKTYAGAISKTASGGEISTLDPGGFGAVTITKSMTIMAIGIEAGILVSGTGGIIISAGAADVVHLEGLNIEGTGSGLRGIYVLSAGAVHIRRCVIRGFQATPGLGIEIAPTATTQVFISDCVIAKNTGGVLVHPTGSGSAQVFLDRVHVENNAGAGIRADGRTTVTRLNNSIVTGNGTGLETAGGGSIVSFGNNVIIGNLTDGNPSQTIQRK